MRLEGLRERAWRANLAIERAGLVVLAFGNASALDRAAGVFAIKPSGLPYEALRHDDMVLVSLDDGSVVEGDHRPSSDTPTHLTIYRTLPGVGGIVHTHSPNATSWAQAGLPIPCLGTTHADHFHGPVPVTRRLRPGETAGDYETNTGLVIAECFVAGGLDAAEMPAVLVAAHGPFAWGPDVERAVENAIALEAVAGMALATISLRPAAEPIDAGLLERHYRRKHGPTAYYGQAPGRAGSDAGAHAADDLESRAADTEPVAE